jgi:hypothetical protein
LILHFRRAVEFGLSAKRETASAFKPRTIGQLMDSQLALCPSFLGMGRCASVIGPGSSTATEHLADAPGDVIKRIESIPMGGTDCALPMVWARRNKLNVSGFVTYTDSETWAGNTSAPAVIADFVRE